MSCNGNVLCGGSKGVTVTKGHNHFRGQDDLSKLFQKGI